MYKNIFIPINLQLIEITKKEVIIEEETIIQPYFDNILFPKTKGIISKIIDKIVEFLEMEI